MLGIPVRSETARQVETRFSARDEIEDPGTGDCAQHLDNHVRNALARWESSSGPTPQGHVGFVSTSGHVTNCVCRFLYRATQNSGDPSNSETDCFNGSDQY